MASEREVPLLQAAAGMAPKRSPARATIFGAVAAVSLLPLTFGIVIGHVRKP